MQYPHYYLGGEGEEIHIAVANGFPPKTYLPLLRPLFEQYHVTSLLPRALWPGQHPPLKYLEWDKTLALDLQKGLVSHSLTNLIAIGHSFGAIASLLAVIHEPQRFRALILLDPTILPQHILWGVRFARLIGKDRGGVLAHRAERRRDQFDHVEAAYTYFKDKPLFATWPDETVRLYAETCIQYDDMVRLAWPPAWEAYYFRTLYTRIWRKLHKLRGLMPILLIRGGISHTLQAQSANHIRQLLPDMTYIEVEKHGHLFPHSAPDRTAQIMMHWLSKLPFHN